jgi:hypothetical protein
MSNRGRLEVEILSRLADDAYRGEGTQSLLANLRSVRDEDWTVLPPGGGRAIGSIAEHAGWCKWMYQDYAFGAATLRGDLPPLVPEGGAPSRPPVELFAWMDEGHRRWLDSIRALADDAELDRPRLAVWGERLPTRRLVEILITHDIYHAGEINHLRSLIQGTDRWPY